MKATTFVPAGACARAFLPRAWLAVQPEDARLDADRPPAAPCAWALLVFNGGPALHEIEVEVLAEDSDDAAMRFQIPELIEGSMARMSLGGPLAEPTHGRYRLTARTREGAPVSLQARFHGLRKPGQVPGFVAEHPCFPLSPGAAWHPDEFAPLLMDNGLEDGSPAGSTAALAFNRRVARLLRGVESLPSAGAAREIAWAAIRAVFGASEADLDQPSVRQLMPQAAGRVLEMADYFIGMHNPVQVVPAGELTVAISPGERPALFLLNTYDHDLAEVRVTLNRMRWSGTSAALQPLEFELGLIRPQEAVRVTVLAEADLDCDLECIVRTGPIEPFSGTIHRAWFPERATADRDTLIPVELLSGAMAQVRRMELTAIIETPEDEDEAPGRMAA